MFEPTASAYVYHAVASNWPSETKTAVEVLAWHNQRGQAENFLKELKHGVGMERNALRRDLGECGLVPPGCDRLQPLNRVPAPRVSGGVGAAHDRHAAVDARAGGAGRIIHHAGQVVLRLVVYAERLALFRGIRRQC